MLAALSRDHVVMVAILCDAGDRYLSEHFWDETRPDHAVAAASVAGDGAR